MEGAAPYHLTGQRLTKQDHCVEIVTTRRGLALVEDDHVALLDTPFPDAGCVIRETGSLAALARSRVVDRIEREAALLDLLPPLGRPAATWGVGLNYHSKAAIAGREAPTSPILYVAAPSSAAGPGEDLALPDGQTEQMDYEGEIAVVVGRRLYQAQPGLVWSSLAAVTAANDITARDVMTTTATPLLAKSFPGFSPLGASVRAVTDADRAAIRVRSWVNGALRQDEDSTDMIFPIDELLARISWFCALEPGDVVLTGTPAGTGQDGGTFLAPGDVVIVEVDGVLPLVNRIVADGNGSTSPASTSAVNRR